MNLARECGLVVANTEIVLDANGNQGLLVERCDLSYNSKTKQQVKLQQEDACQLMNLYPADKYRIGTQEIITKLQKYSTSAIVLVAEFLKLKIYSYLIANGDLHAKNISLLAKNGLIQLSPAYDLLTTLPYGDLSMTLQFEGRKDNIKGRDFVSFGKRYGLNEKVIKNVINHLYEAFENVNISKLEKIGWSEEKTKHLEKLIRKRRADLVSF